MDRTAISAEMAAAYAQLHALLSAATPADLRRRSNGTRWTNSQLLFHMVLGCAVVRVLLPLVRLMGRLPAPVGRGWAALLNAAARPFHLVNYAGPVLAVRLLSPARIDALGASVIAGLQRALSRETEAALQTGMPLPTRWDPFFRDWMSLAEVYRYATQHFEHHRRQLTLPAAPAASTPQDVSRRWRSRGRSEQEPPLGG